MTFVSMLNVKRVKATGTTECYVEILAKVVEKPVKEDVALTKEDTE